MSKSARNKRLLDFRAHVLEGIMDVYNVEKRDNGSYTIDTQNFGVLDLYPKADKLLFREDGRWIKGGIEWVCNNL